jgi:hypothetical protein
MKKLVLAFGILCSGLAIGQDHSYHLMIGHMTNFPII